MTTTGHRSSGWLGWILLVVVLAGALVVGSVRTQGPQTDQDRVVAIARTIKCPTCQGESVAESDAGPSKEIRRDIAVRVQQGQSDDEIRSYYADRYGDAILLTPPRSGIESLVWVIPVVALIVAVAGLVATFRRWRSEPAKAATDADRELVERALEDLDAREGRA